MNNCLLSIFRYELCYFINVDDFLDSGQLNRATYTSECGSNPSSVTFYSDGPTNDTTELDIIRTRTFTKTVQVERGSNSSYCGSTYNDVSLSILRFDRLDKLAFRVVLVRRLRVSEREAWTRDIFSVAVWLKTLCL